MFLSAPASEALRSRVMPQLPVEKVAQTSCLQAGMPNGTNFLRKQ